MRQMLKHLNPRAMVIGGCAMLALAGMEAFVAWLGTVPPRDQLLHLTGQLQQLTLTDARKGAFQVTLVSGGSLLTLDFDNAHRLVARARGGGSLHQGTPVSIDYFAYGRSKKVVDVVLGDDRVLSYDDVARLAAEKVAKDGSSALGFAVLGAVIVLIGGLARLARGSARQAPEANPELTVGALCWLAFYGIMLVVILTEPATLHRAWGTQAFGLPIEYVVPPALALIWLPLWPGFMGFASLMRQALRKGRAGKFGLLLELRSALQSSDPTERRTGLKALWFLGYFAAVIAAWIVYAAMLGI